MPGQTSAGTLLTTSPLQGSAHTEHARKRLLSRRVCQASRTGPQYSEMDTASVTAY